MTGSLNRAHQSCFKEGEEGSTMYGIPLRQEGSGLFPEFKEDTIFVTMATREQAEDKAFKDKSCLKTKIPLDIVRASSPIPKGRR